MNLTRRSSLAVLGLLGGAMALPVRASQHRIERIGVQLYTLRAAMALDTAATLAAVAAAGYSEVEIAGTGNLKREQFAEALRNTALTAPSAHVPFLHTAKSFPGGELAACHQFVPLAAADHDVNRRLTVLP